MTSLAVRWPATYFHCGEEWKVQGTVDIGEFIPDDPAHLKCPACGKISGTFCVLDAPVPGHRDLHRTKRSYVSYSGGSGAAQTREFDDDEV